MRYKASDYGQAYFDGGEGYHTYQDAGHFAEKAKWLVDEFQPQTVLEIGCAKGFLVKALRDLGVSAYGCDISEYAINEAPEVVRDYLYLVDITAKEPITLPKFDLIVSYDTFEHLPEDVLDNVFNFMNNVGTRFYIQVGTENTPNWQHDATHITIKPLSFWQERFEEAIWVESL
jgi:cyclopropane fatty-acyl-phospholipid synthase-like methyltransferase